MRSGKLRDRANIQQDTSNDDTPTPTWTGTPLVANWPCDILPIGGDESYRGRQLEAKVDYVATGRFVDGVTAEMRLYVTAGQQKAKTLNIEQAHEKRDNRNRPILELYCTELTT